MTVNRERWLVAHDEERSFWEQDWKTVGIQGHREIIEEYWSWYIELIQEYCDLTKGKVLDVGCGPDGLINYLPGSKSRYALDPLMDICASNYKLPPEVNWVTGVGESMPFRDQAFDAIISTNALDHTRSPLEILMEMHRCLRKGGCLFLTMDCYPGYRKVFRQALEKINLGDKPHPFSFSVADTSRLISKAGFEVRAVNKGIGNLGVYIFARLSSSRSIRGSIARIRREQGLIALLPRIWRYAYLRLRNSSRLVLRGEPKDFVFIARKP